MSTKLYEVTVPNRKALLTDLERSYVPLFSTSGEKERALQLLAAVYNHCQIDPHDSSLIYPNGTRSLSSLMELLTFFICDKKRSSLIGMPPDAPAFLRFLKSIRYEMRKLCLINMKG